MLVDDTGFELTKTKSPSYRLVPKSLILQRFPAFWSLASPAENQLISFC